MRISSRDLAAACKASRRNVQYALDNLTGRELLTKRKGTPNHPATYRVHIFDTLRIREKVRIGGVVPTPPPPRKHKDTPGREVCPWK